MSYSDPSKLKEEIVKILVLLALLPLLTSAAPLVQTPWGQLQGLARVTPYNVTYHAFLGVPYALSPVGQRRFAPTVPHPGPSGLFQAVTSPPACPQPNPDDPNVSEDCLFLNVFTPANLTSPSSADNGTSDNATVGSAALRPVLVVIHGGGSISGSADDVKAWKLVTHADVIVVAVQYRLGALGFLSTGDDVIAGNWALWDQKMALEWVQANIRGFGGDPGAVILMGDSAGAANAGLLSLHPGCSGLFSKVLLQSGAPSASWAVLPHFTARARAVALYRKLGCSSNVTSSEITSQAILTCLRSKPASDIARYSRLEVPLEISLTQNLWSPVVDGAFLVRSPEAALSDPNFLSSVPFSQSDLLLNLNNNEGGLLLDFTKNMAKGSSRLTDRDFYRHLLLPALLQQRFHSEVPDWVADAVTSFYIGEGNASLAAVLHIYSDFIFVAPIIQYARAHAQLSAGDTRMLVLDHYPPDLPLGISHSGEDRYQGGLEEERDDDPGEDFRLTEEQYAQELEVSQVFLSLIGSFAYSNGSDTLALPIPLSGLWPRYTSAQEDYVSVTSEPRLRQHPWPSRLAFQTEILPALHRMALTSTSSTTTPSGAPTTTSAASDWLFGVSGDVARNVGIGLLALCALLLIVVVALAACVAYRSRRRSDPYYVDSECGTQKY